jgi:DNA ligase (NAD+)
MDIEGLGDKLVDQLVERGLVKHVAGVYSLDVAALEARDQWDQSAENLRAAIDRSRARRYRASSMRSASARWVRQRHNLARHFGIGPLMERASMN